MPASILLVDDDRRNLLALESILNSPDYRLVLVQSAEEALRALLREDFAVLVLDVRMPRVSGLELAQIIKGRKRTEHLPIIFLSAYYQEEEHALLGYDAGAIDYLTKPLNPAVLRSKVAAFVGMYRMNKALQDEIAVRIAAERRLAERTSEVQELVIQLRALALELTQTEQRERKRLAKTLHDHIQQLIASALLQLAVVRRGNNDERIAESIKTVESTLKEAICVSRSVTVELSPPMLQESGLAAGLEWFGDRLRKMHDFKVVIRADGEAEPRSEEVRFLLFECTRELLFNAVKHSGASEATITIRQLKDERIEITVEDQGSGFDVPARGCVRGGQATFGLFSVQQRLAHLGGGLSICSGIGSGTKITLTSPPMEIGRPARFSDLRESEKPSVTGKAPVSAGTIKVLIVDDQTIMRQALTGLLEREDDIAVVGEASNGPEAIERVLQLHPDVVVMDVDLGDSSGIEATEYILERDPNTKVVGLSMHGEEVAAEDMRKAGAVAYLTKEVESDKLLAVIRSSCRDNCSDPK